MMPRIRVFRFGAISCFCLLGIILWEGEAPAEPRWIENCQEPAAQEPSTQKPSSDSIESESPSPNGQSTRVEAPETAEPPAPSTSTTRVGENLDPRILSGSRSEGPMGVGEHDARTLELLSLVKDSTTQILKREMPAYWKLVDKSIASSMDDMIEHSRKNPKFNDFYTYPAKHRGELVSTTINIRKVTSYPIDPSLNHSVDRLYELWGWTDESKAWMYCIVTPELPPGFPQDGECKELVMLAGYFFKMQAYQPGNAAPNSKMLNAPLIIGKVSPIKKVLDSKESESGNWVLLFVTFFALIIMLRIILRMRFSMFAPSSSAHAQVRRRLRTMPDALQDSDPVEENS